MSRAIWRNIWEQTRIQQILWGKFRIRFRLTPAEIFFIKQHFCACSVFRKILNWVFMRIIKIDKSCRICYDIIHPKVEKNSIPSKIMLLVWKKVKRYSNLNILFSCVLEKKLFILHAKNRCAFLSHVKEIFYITGESKKAVVNSPFVEKLRKKGYEV